MNEKSKSISGLNIVQKRKVKNRFTVSEKQKIIEEFLTSDCTKREIWEKYTGEKEEHGQLLRWMRQLGYDSTKNTSTFASKGNTMGDDEKEGRETFEILQQKKRIEELEKQLRESEMKAIAFSTMIDIAEEELKISIRKKYNTKP